MITAKVYQPKSNTTFYAQADDHDAEKLHARLMADDPLWNSGVSFVDLPRKDEPYFRRGLAIWNVHGTE